MQLKVNRHRQRQEKVHFYPFFSSFFTREFIYWTLWSLPPLPCSPQPPPPWRLSASFKTSWRRYTILKMSNGGTTEEAGEVKKYSFQIGFSLPLCICWIVLAHMAEGAVWWGGGTRPSCGRNTIESVTEEPNAHQINSSRRGGKRAQVEDSVTHAPLTEIIPLPSQLPPF